MDFGVGHELRVGEARRIAYALLARIFCGTHLQRPCRIGKLVCARDFRQGGRLRIDSPVKWGTGLLRKICDAYLPRIAPRISGIAAMAAFIVAFAPSYTETAAANGETRTIHLFHTHTQEQISATYLVNGQYDPAVLKQLNWFLRDWRRDEPTNMDPRLFDVVWEAYRTAGASEVIHVVSAYRSPETNAMLRRRSRAVAKYSQHMLGKAMDTTLPGMSMSRIREIGMRMQRGGVGYYPTAGTPFVHLDVGNVRSWPRMTYDQLARLFPDGKTVHLPTNGQPLARYEEAKAEIEARGGGAYVPAERRKGFFAFLFGGGGGDDEEDGGEAAPAPSGRKQWASLAPRPGRGAQGAAESEEEGGAPSANGGKGQSDMLARAENDLPKGETAMSAVGANAPLPPVRPSSLDRASGNGARTAVASLEPGFETDSGAGANAISAPLPPRRPHGLAALASAPLPPNRPGDSTSPGQTASIGGGRASGLVGRKEKDLNAAAALARLIDVTGSTGARPELASTHAHMRPEADHTSAGEVPNSSESRQSLGRPDDAALAYASTSRLSGLRSEAPTGLRAAARSAAKRNETAPAHAEQSDGAAASAVSPGLASRIPGASVFGSALSALRVAAKNALGASREAPAAGDANVAHDASAPDDQRKSGAGETLR